jgi:hypothetical protein
MKKILSILLASICLLFCLTACGNSQDPANDPNFDISVLVGKTIGELEASGWEYYQCATFSDSYRFKFVTKTRTVIATVELNEEYEKAEDAIDSNDPKRNEKRKELRSSLVISKIAFANDAPLSKDELSKYVGQKASALINDGFEVVGFTKVLNGYSFSFEKGNQCYEVTLDNAVKGYMDDYAFSSDEYKTVILEYEVEKIKYDKPY